MRRGWEAPVRRGWVTEISFQPAGSRGPNAGPGLKAADLARAASANHTSSPYLAAGLVQLSALLRPGPSFGPRRDLPEPCLPRPAGRRASSEVRSRDSPQQTAQILPVTPLTGADYDFEVRRRQKEIPWGWGGGRWGAVPVKPVCSQLSLSFKKIIKANL